MDYPEVWRWDEQTDDEKKESYRNLLADYRKAIKVSDAFVKLAGRLSDY